MRKKLYVKKSLVFNVVLAALLHITLPARTQSLTDMSTSGGLLLGADNDNSRTDENIFFKVGIRSNNEYKNNPDMIVMRKRVGINTNAPQAALEVITPDATTNRVQLMGSDHVNATWRIGTPNTNQIAFGGNSNHNIDLGYFTGDNAVFTSRLHVNQSGKVGIGTTSPVNRLQLQTDDFNAAIGFSTNGGRTPTQARIRVEDMNWSGNMVFETSEPGGSTGSLQERFRINSSGWVVTQNDMTVNGRFFVENKATQQTVADLITRDNNAYAQALVRTTLRIINSPENPSQSKTLKYYGGTMIDHGKKPYLQFVSQVSDVNNNLMPQEVMPMNFLVGQNNIMQVYKNSVLMGDLPNIADGLIPYSGLNYVLGVRGRIVSESVTCKALSAWADHVFNDEYKLMPLSATEAFIKANKHLPGIPSENELKKSGIDVTEMLKLQMQKIEELTLHVIEQQKQIDKLLGQVKQ